MIVYQAVNQFFCSPLKRYMLQGAMVARYENATRLIIVFAPTGPLSLEELLKQGTEYTDYKDVTWFYGVEPPPRGTFLGGQFVQTMTVSEDPYGNVIYGTTWPTDSKLKPDSTGRPYLQNDDTGLWHMMKLTGPDGAPNLQIALNGVAVLP